MEADATSSDSISTGFSAQLDLYESVTQNMAKKHKFVNILTIICLVTYSIPQVYFLA